MSSFVKKLLNILHNINARRTLLKRFLEQVRAHISEYDHFKKVLNHFVLLF